MALKSPDARARAESSSGNYTTKSVAELNEMIDRQTKLLKNKIFLGKLPDKGKKIEEIVEKLKAALKVKEEEHILVNLLSDLKLRPSKMDVDSMEWKPQLLESSDQTNTNPGSEFNATEGDLDSDDTSADERTVLKVLASGTAKEKRVRQKKAEVVPITVEDLALLENEDPEARKLVQTIAGNTNQVLEGRLLHKDITEKSQAALGKEHFKPYKSLKHDHVTPELIKELAGSSNSSDTSPVRRTRSLLSKVITAATPPALKFGEVKPIGLQESLELQRHQVEKAREMELRQAAERLAGKLHIPLTVDPDFSRFTQYQIREPHAVDSEDEKDTKLYDDEDVGVGVSFPIMD